MSEYDLEKLIQARKLRTHCKGWTVDAVLDEVVKLYNKYYLPNIQAADKEIANWRRSFEHNEMMSNIQQQEIAAKDAELARLREALEQIIRWDGFPETNSYWDEEKTQPMSYGAAYGSNGERDFMRALAEKALKSNGSEDSE